MSEMFPLFKVQIAFFTTTNAREFYSQFFMDVTKGGRHHITLLSRNVKKERPKEIVELMAAGCCRTKRILFKKREINWKKKKIH